MLLQIIVGVAFMVVFALNLFGDERRSSRIIHLTKPLLIPLIIVFYLLSADTINWLIVAALFFGFLGDVFLLRSDDLSFILGLSSFLAGHIFYITAFVQSTDHLAIVPGWFYLLLIPYIAYAAFVLRRLWPHLGRAKIPVLVYMTALLFMSFTSLCRVWNGFDIHFLLPFVGSLFFVASDSCLSYRIFVDTEGNYEVAIMLTYVFAQCLIMAGFL